MWVMGRQAVRPTPVYITVGHCIHSLSISLNVMDITELKPCLKMEEMVTDSLHDGNKTNSIRLNMTCLTLVLALYHTVSHTFHLLVF